MNARIGLVDLCTSHPGSWVPILRELGCEIASCWDSGDTRPEGFAAEFAKDKEIPHAAAEPSDMLGKIDVAIIHSANWDKHVELARPFVEAGVAVLIDKPMVGCLRDAGQIMDWAKLGKRLTGGSSLRFADEVREFLAEPVEERGTVHTTFVGCGVDEFNYGIHAYATLSGLMGPGIRSVRYLGASTQKHVRVTWEDGRVGFLCIGTPGRQGGWLPFYATAVSEKAVRQITVATGGIYRALIEAVLPYLAGDTDEPPLPMDDLIEPELTALAARQSWLRGGAEVFLTDLSLDDPGYDGARFAIEYARKRLGS